MVEAGVLSWPWGLVPWFPAVLWVSARFGAGLLACPVPGGLDVHLIWSHLIPWEIPMICATAVWGPGSISRLAALLRSEVS